MNMVYVATRFEISRRRENLSWSHHAELAALDNEEQERWLNRASDHRLSVQDLRRGLSGARDASHAHRRNEGQRTADTGALGRSKALKRRQPPDGRSSGEGDVDRLLTCPHCGYRFVDGGECHQDTTEE